jgi:hypothetical protein
MTRLWPTKLLPIRLQQPRHPRKQLLELV